MNKLLIAEHPLVILPTLACQYGINEAILLQQIHYWLQKTTFTHDGKPWIYNTAEQWHEQIPFISIATISRAISSLQSKQLIFVEKLSLNKSNRTNYYTINYPALTPMIQAALAAQPQKPNPAEPPESPQPKPKQTARTKTKLPPEWAGRIFMGAIHETPCPVMLGSTLHRLLSTSVQSHMDWLTAILAYCNIEEGTAYQIVSANTPFADVHLSLTSVQIILAHIDSPQSQAIKASLNKLMNLAFKQIDTGELS